MGNLFRQALEEGAFGLSVEWLIGIYAKTPAIFDIFK